MKMISFREYLCEGGWASTSTQNTKLTPDLVAHAVEVIKHFVEQFNSFLETDDIPPTEFGGPCGSTTYYQRDLKQNPDREYGDIDVNFHIPQISGMSNAANVTFFKKKVIEFCRNHHEYQTTNGTNVIITIGSDHIQIDLVMSFLQNKEWQKALAPEYNVKGVLCNSLYSALAEALHLSISGHGIQAKSVDGQQVSFRTLGNFDLKSIGNNPKTWAIDIAKHFGCKRMSPRLKAFGGMIGEPRTADMVNSIRGIAETLESNGKLPSQHASAKHLVDTIRTIYLNKINKVIESSKFDKAATPKAIEKAKETKETLKTKSKAIASLLRIA